MKKKGMISPGGLILVLIIIALVIVSKLTGYSIFDENYKNDRTPYKIAELSKLDLDTVDSYENYKTFADRINAFIYIVNENLGINIPLLETTQDAWDKASKTITKYGPLIDNYNRVISSSKEFVNEPSKIKYKQFYQALGTFSLELTFISAVLFHTAVFNSVGALYKASGLSAFALKCSSCISTILSSAYWTIKTVLVERASEGADYIFEQLRNLNNFGNRGD